ncbi:hypothetical protein [Cesiribacter sp. SM1]|uniref:hypothetical protein n=1 Tax=Cesiribacter sp. SM1 TaxID=2861196 RepID=UPI001CD1DBCD|nr:hypothetical protein [Cesiribacter sp. SM1]
MPIIRLDPDSPMGHQLQQLQTLYYGVISLPLVFFLVLYLQTTQQAYDPYLAGEGLLWLHLLVWLLVLAGSAWAVCSYNKRLKSYSRSASLESKFNAYVHESRRLYFMLAPLMLLPVAAMWATGVIFYGALFSLMVILVASLRPMVEQCIRRMQLSKNEQEALAQRS